LELGVIEISEEKRNDLKTSIDECNEQLAAAEHQLIEIYGEGTVSAVRSAINIYKEINPAMNATDIAADLTSMDGKSAVNPDTKSKILDIIGDVTAEVVQSIAKTYQSQSDIIQKQKKLTDMQMAYSEATVKDKRLQKLRIEEQIRAVQDDLDFLKPLVTGTVTEMGKTSTQSESAEDALMISSSTDKAEDDFMDVIIKCDEQGSFSSNSSSSMASRSRRVSAAGSGLA
jgi:flagellar biosynthesis chaperone FliJ